MALTNNQQPNIKEVLFNKLTTQDASIFNQSPSDFRRILENIDIYLDWINQSKAPKSNSESH